MKLRIVELFEDDTGRISSKRVLGITYGFSALFMAFTDVDLEVIATTIAGSCAFLGISWLDRKSNQKNQQLQ